MIGRLPPLKRFVLGNKYGLKKWLFSAYESLVDNAHPPAADELEVLGFDKVARLMRAREAMYLQYLKNLEAQRGYSKKEEDVSTPAKKKSKEEDGASAPAKKKSKEEEGGRIPAKKNVTPVEAVQLSASLVVQQYFE